MSYKPQTKLVVQVCILFFPPHTKPVNLYIVILRVKQSSYFKILPKDKQFSALGGFPLTAVGFTSI